MKLANRTFILLGLFLLTVATCAIGQDVSSDSKKTQADLSAVVVQAGMCRIAT